MENECNVDYQPSSSGVTSGISLPYFYRPLRALYLSRIFFEFSFKPVYPIGWGKFSNSWCVDHGKLHLRFKELNIVIFTHAPPGKTLAQVFAITPQSEVSHSPQTAFF